jgi:hypothetical protein
VSSDPTVHINSTLRPSGFFGSLLLCYSLECSTFWSEGYSATYPYGSDSPDHFSLRDFVKLSLLSTPIFQSSSSQTPSRTMDSSDWLQKFNYPAHLCTLKRFKSHALTWIRRLSIHVVRSDCWDMLSSFTRSSFIMDPDLMVQIASNSRYDGFCCSSS